MRYLATSSIVDELPKTGTQRIQYAALKARGVAGAWDREKAGIKVERAKMSASVSRATIIRGEKNGIPGTNRLATFDSLL